MRSSQRQTLSGHWIPEDQPDCVIDHLLFMQNSVGTNYIFWISELSLYL